MRHLDIILVDIETFMMMDTIMDRDTYMVIDIIMALDSL
jgi:hypothetical protein